MRVPDRRLVVRRLTVVGDALAGGERLAEHSHCFTGRGVDHHLAVVEHDGAVADLADEIRCVGDEEDRAALALEPLDALDALALEGFVAHRQHLVDQQDVGVDVDRHREAEANVHARRVVAHLHVDELLELCECDDLVEHVVGLAFRQSQDRRIHVDVLATGQLVVEAGTELEQRGHAAAREDLTGRRLQDAGDALEQRRLARSVVAEQPDGRPLFDRERHLLQRPERLEWHAPEVDDLLLQRRVVLVVQAELLRDTADLDRGDHDQSSSAKFASARPNTYTASASTISPNASDIPRYATYAP